MIEVKNMTKFMMLRKQLIILFLLYQRKIAGEYIVMKKRGFFWLFYLIEKDDIMI